MTALVDVALLPILLPNKNVVDKLAHQKAHWSSCSIDLPVFPSKDCIERICKQIPKSILRVKGCVQIAKETHYTYFERTPDGKVFVRPFKGVPITGTKLLAIGAGSDQVVLEKVITDSLNTENKA